MLRLVTNTPAFYGDICDEMRLFFDEKRIAPAKNVPEEGCAVSHSLDRKDGLLCSRAVLYRDGREIARREEPFAMPESGGSLEEKRVIKRAVKLSVYRLLKEAFQKELPWGSLTGIRPAKLARELADMAGEEKARSDFLRVFDVSPSKTALAFETARNQKAIVQSVREGDADVYIGIPFCPSRCHYCSFVSNDIRACAGLVDGYIDALLRELRTVLDALRPAVRAVYIGGGTPAALNEQQLQRLLSACAAYFEGALEYSFEAGRPDAVTHEKLTILKRYGVGRLCVNPQTLHDATLARIGRAHTVRDFERAFQTARSAGFTRINTDIIAGLPGETPRDMRETVGGIVRLQPENVTVHALAVKRASVYHEKGVALAPRAAAQRMIEECGQALRAAGYRPYYLYRQKHMTGDLENTGYAKEGTECLYNVDIMEETAHILAFGAGGISKKVTRVNNRIERAPNVSDLAHYLRRVDEMAKRKLELFANDTRP